LVTVGGLHQARASGGAYIWTDSLGEAFAAKTLAQRTADAIATASASTGYGAALTKAVSVAWAKIPFSGAGWAEWSRTARRDAYRGCCRATGRSGSPASTCPTSPAAEGAVLSAMSRSRTSPPDTGETRMTRLPA